MSSIEEILKNESFKLNERRSTEILISIPSELVRGVFKYKKGEYKR